MELPVVSGVQQEWIQFDDDTEVLLEFPSREEFKKELKKAEKVAKRTGEVVNDILHPSLARKYVKNWRKIDDHSHTGFTHGGEQFPCNEENIMFLVKNSYTFNAFLGEHLANEMFFLQLAKDKERAGKN